MTKPIAGVLPIAHTPFTEKDQIDWTSMQKQLDWAFDVGAAGFCTGMVSELLRLTADERAELTKQLGALNDRRGVFIAGVGAESTRQAVVFTEQAQAADATGVMAIPPISGSIDDSHLVEYFQAIAQVGLPVIVQDASSYVGRPIPLSVCKQLLDEFGPDRILFKPEAEPLGPNLSLLRDATGGEAWIFEGSGGISLIDSFRRGIAGTMPGMEFLEGIVAVWEAMTRGDDEAAYRVYFPVCALVAIQLQAGLDGFLAIEKYVLHKRGLFATDRRRRPYRWEMDDETRAEVDRLLAILDRVLGESD